MLLAVQSGDSLVLMNLKVKSSSMVAKQGSTVRRISLDHDNAEYIEGKVGPTQIVIISNKWRNYRLTNFKFNIRVDLRKRTF